MIPVFPVILETPRNSFKKLSANLNASARRLREAESLVVRELADDGSKELRDNIKRQSETLGIRFRAITDKWIARKNAAGWREETLVRTEAYADSIYANHSKKNLSSIAVRSGNYDGSKITNADLARFLEFGTQRMPGIPHWRSLRSYLHRQAKMKLQEGVTVAVRISG